MYKGTHVKNHPCQTLTILNFPLACTCHAHEKRKTWARNAQDNQCHSGWRASPRRANKQQAREKPARRPAQPENKATRHKNTTPAKPRRGESKAGRRAKPKERKPEQKPHGSHTETAKTTRLEMRTNRCVNNAERWETIPSNKMGNNPKHETF